MHLGKLLQHSEAKIAGLVILPLGGKTFDAPIATWKLILNVTVSVAQFERKAMKRNQVEGINRANSKYLYKGRVPTANATGRRG